MKNISIFILILLSFSMQGQSIDQLDIKNGFREFKFGTLANQIKNIEPVENQYSKNENVKSYYYMGEKIKYVANVKSQRITLHFYKERLFSISVSFANYDPMKSFELNEYNNILDALENTYGKKWYSPNNNDGVILNGAIWDGKKIRLELMRTDYSLSKTNPKNYDGMISGYIVVYDKEMNNLMYSSEF